MGNSIFNVTYELNTPWPVGTSNPDSLEAIDWIREGTIPFVPVAGLMIDCGDGDFRKVDTVYWRAEDPRTLSVFFEVVEDDHKADFYLSNGWSTKDLPNG